MSGSSKIFVKNRALGYVSNNIPVVVRYIQRRKECVMVTCVGRHFHTYGSAHFTLLNVSGAHPEDITSLAADRFLIHTAAGNTVYSWRMGTQIKHVFNGHTSPVHLLLPFGAHLLSVDESSTLKMWDVKAGDLYTELEFDVKSFRITTLLHPNTYINKILFGSEQGQLQLWNLHTRKLIFTFPGWKSAVTALEQAPAVDVVAIGLADGRIFLHNLRLNKSIVDFSQDWGCVTAITFRTDGPPIMVSGTGAGHVLLWDLEKREPVGQMWNAHYAAVTGLKCLPSDPLLISSSPDNSLKMWIFDMPDGTGRLLKIREGHSLPPTTVKFYTNDQIFSAGSDSSLRVFSTVTETKNHSYGRAVFNKKMFKKVKNKRSPDAPLLMPPVVSLAYETARSKEWDDMAALHRGLAEVTTWSSDKGCMGSHKLLHSRFKEQPELRSAVATCLCLTHCGNFALLGYSTGHLDRFNMQSGQHRCEYSMGSGKPAHQGATRGVAAEGLNQAVVSGGADAVLRFWNFKDGHQLAQVSLSDAVAFFSQQRESSLLAVALDDNSVCIVDMDSKTIVRRLPGHMSRLTALEFTPDSRWLLVATMDCNISTWDVPSAHMIDIFRTSSPVVSMSLNSTGELLATCHVDYLGVFVWCNRTVHTHVSLRPLPFNAEAPLVELPCPGERPSLVETEEDMEYEEQDFKSPEQIGEELVTLSSLATSRWLNVLDLEVIKKRNKPKQPPKAPKSAPFFLPTTKSLDPQFDVRPSLEEQNKSPGVSTLMAGYNKLTRMLMANNPDDDETIVMLKGMGPSALDVEVLSLAPEGGGSVEAMRRFLGLLCKMLVVKKDFELSQSYLALFLKHHATLVMTEPVLVSALRVLQPCQLEAWKSLEYRLTYCMSVVQAFRQL